MPHWLHGVTLFGDAWRTVCTGNWAWLWSIQLCTFTVAVWSPFIAIEGYRRRIPHVWAYMIFGQVVAISTSSALFFAVCLMYQQHRTSSSASPSWILIISLYLASIGGLITVHYTPQLTDSKAFLPNLLVMHGLLVLPLFYLAWSGTPISKQVDAPQYSKSYAIIGLYSIGSLANMYLISQQWINTVTAGTSFQEITNQLLQTFLQYPTLSSIGSDVVCVYLISLSWMLVNTSPSFLVYSLIIFTSFLPPSITFPIYLAVDEYNSLYTPHRVSHKTK